MADNNTNTNTNAQTRTAADIIVDQDHEVIALWCFVSSVVKNMKILTEGDVDIRNLLTEIHKDEMEKAGNGTPDITVLYKAAMSAYDALHESVKALGRSIVDLMEDLKGILFGTEGAPKDTAEDNTEEVSE